MKKVLILANSSVGLCAFRNETVLELLKKYEVVVSLPDEVRMKELTEEGCRVVRTPINRRGINPLEDFRLYKSYRRLIKEERPDLVLTYTIKPNIYGGYACRKMKVPYMTTITGLGGAFDRKGLLLKLIVSMYRAGMKKAECIFFQNSENKEIFDRYGIKGRKSRMVMGSGVNLDKHPFTEYPRGEKTILLFMGRVLKERGIEEYLEAARSLHDEKTEFAIMGSCDENYEALLKDHEKQGIISLWGFQKDVHAFLARAGAVVVASFHEGMSNTLIEAAATGRVVIASRISGCMEAFEEGVTGFGFTPGNSAELIEAIRKFLDCSAQERAEMGRRAREKMEREFDRRLVTEAYMGEVEKVL